MYFFLYYAEYRLQGVLQASTYFEKESYSESVLALPAAERFFRTWSGSEVYHQQLITNSAIL